MHRKIINCIICFAGLYLKSWVEGHQFGAPCHHLCNKHLLTWIQNFKASSYPRSRKPQISFLPLLISHFVYAYIYVFSMYDVECLLTLELLLEKKSVLRSTRNVKINQVWQPISNNFIKYEFYVLIKLYMDWICFWPK